MTGGAYLGSLGLAGVLFYFFNPSGAGDCSFNVSMITFTLILGLAMTGVSMTPSLVSLSFQSTNVQYGPWTALIMQSLMQV